MENSLTDTEREKVWHVLSEFFVDTEIDRDYWARQISQFPIATLEDIFFREVAPVCGPNVLTPVPPVWDGFDFEWVVTQIKRNLSKRKASLFYRMRYDASVIYYRVRCRDFWDDIENAIIRIRSKQYLAGKSTRS